MLNPSERQYVTQLVAGQGKDFSKKTAAIISNGDPITVPQVRYIFKTQVWFDEYI